MLAGPCLVLASRRVPNPEGPSAWADIGMGKDYKFRGHQPPLHDPLGMERGLARSRRRSYPHGGNGSIRSPTRPLCFFYNFPDTVLGGGKAFPRFHGDTLYVLILRLFPADPPAGGAFDPHGPVGGF